MVATIDVKDAAGVTQTLNAPLPPGRVAAAVSRPIAWSNEDSAAVGALTETAPASDTASSGLNGRMQRLAQRLTSLLGVFPANFSTVAVKGGSTSPVTGDPALVVTISPNCQNPNGPAAASSSSPVVNAINTANGATSSRVVAAATTNATSLKTSAGNLVDIDLFNVAAYTVFVKFYNKASAPTVGTDTPVWTLPLPTGSGYGRSFPFGKLFSTGIAYAITKLQADSDTTVVAAGDVTGSIDWI